MDYSTILILISIILFSSFIRTAIGFGDAIIAMPILSILLGLTVATPLIGITTILLGILILRKEKTAFHFKNIKPLILPTLIGIPIGIYCLTADYESIFKIILGIVIILFALFNLLKIPMSFGKSPLIFGFLAGAFGGAYNTSGPPIVIYATSQDWDARTFKATLQGFFIGLEIMVVFGHGISGLWTATVFNYLLLALPPLLIGFFLGNYFFGKLNEEKIRLAINIFLMVMGLILLVKSW